MKKIFILLFFFIIVIIGSFFLPKSQTQPSLTPITTSSPTPASPNPVDYTASFAIFTNGTFRIFTSPMYHNLSQDVFIQADNPNIIHVKKEGITWDDFFKTLPFSLKKDCLITGTKQTFCTNANGTLRFYLNGKEDANALDKKITEGDKLLVTYGKENETQLQEQMKQIPTVQ